jgi:hypothetical protein
MLHISDDAGEPLHPRDSPPGIALLERRPAHSVMRATAADGSTHTVEVTAYPLFATPEELHGVVAIFWENTDA